MQNSHCSQSPKCCISLLTHASEEALKCQTHTKLSNRWQVTQPSSPQRSGTMHSNAQSEAGCGRHHGTPCSDKRPVWLGCICFVWFLNASSLLFKANKKSFLVQKWGAGEGGPGRGAGEEGGAEELGEQEIFSSSVERGEEGGGTASIQVISRARDVLFYSH